jgi:hypothetical protein
MDRVKQNSKGMNMQKCHSSMKRFPVEAILHGIAGTHICTSIVVSTKASTVVHTQTSTVVRSCSCVTMRVCSGSDEGLQIRKPVKQCIYKSIIIHILKDSKQ